MGLPHLRSLRLHAGFIGFVRFIGLIGFMGLLGFLGLIGLIGLGLYRFSISGLPDSMGCLLRVLLGLKVYNGFGDAAVAMEIRQGLGCPWGLRVLSSRFGLRVRDVWARIWDSPI